MKPLLLWNKKKRGVSEVIAYVLLISIAVSLSILVYNWLRFYVQDTEVEQCKEGTSIVIQDYQCSLADGGSLNLTLKNKGRFNIDGFILRVHNRVGADIGLYTLDENGTAITTSQVYNHLYLFSEARGNSSVLSTLTLIEVQPFIYEDTEKTFCEKVSSQSVQCE